MFVLCMQTQNFTWLTAGETEEEAREALRKTWEFHLEQYGRGPDTFRSDEIEEQYEPSVYELGPGEGFRDYDKLLSTSTKEA
jgi:hypothetical protein